MSAAGVPPSQSVSFALSGGTRHEALSEPLEYALRTGAIGCTRSPQRCRHHRFDRSAARVVNKPAAPRQLEQRAAPIADVPDALKQALFDEPLQDAGERARMDMENLCQAAGGQAGSKPNDPEHQPLRPGDTQITRHTLRPALDSVHDRPQQLHELKHVGQSQVV